MNHFQSEITGKKLHRYKKPSCNFGLKTGHTPSACCIKCKKKTAHIIENLPDEFKIDKWVKNSKGLMELTRIAPRPLINSDGFCPVCEKKELVERYFQIIDLLQQYCNYSPLEAVNLVRHGVKKGEKMELEEVYQKEENA